MKSFFQLLSFIKSNASIFFQKIVFKFKKDVKTRKHESKKIRFVFLNTFVKRLIDIMINKYDDQTMFKTKIKKLMKDMFH